MGPACRHLGAMVQVCTAMVPAMECLMAAGSIRGFAEALVLVSAEVLVEAGAAVAAEADLFIGSRFKLAVSCRKDGYYAKRRRYRAYGPGSRHRPGYGSRPRPR